MSQSNCLGVFGFASLLSLPISACSAVCGPREFPEGGSCSDGQTTRVSTDSLRIDLRDPQQTLTLKIDVQRTKTDSPLFHANPDFTLPLGVVGPRSGSIRGRTAVQVAGPFGEPGRLLVTATADTVVGAVRWQELFSAQPGSKLAYDSSGVWMTEQQKQQEGPTALLALGKGAVLIYDNDMAKGRWDLALLPLLGTRVSRLSMVDDHVPKNATALAACAEESLVFLAEANHVQAFAFDPALGASPLRHLQSFDVTDSAPLVATRDVAGVVPMLRSQRYVAAVSTREGAVQLVPVTGKTPATYAIHVPGLRSVSLGRGISALALADLDSDGLQDLVFAQSDGQLGFVPQSPDGSFPAAPTLLGAKLEGAISISVGDLNGDTFPDIAVATQDIGAVYGNAHVFFNLPN